MPQRELFAEPPVCPGCGSPDLRLEDAATGRHQCRRCLWRCRIGANGKATSWLNLGTAGKRPARPADDRHVPKIKRYS